MILRRSMLGAGIVGAAIITGFQVKPSLRQNRMDKPDIRLARYHMPLESAPHARTFMQWPVSKGVYDSAQLSDVQGAILRIANSIALFEPVTLLASRKHHAKLANRISSSVELWDVPTDDLWCRDSGPTFIVDEQGQQAIAHIQFNGWGRKQPHANDARIASVIAERLGIPLLATGLIGEQGGVEHDGAGTLLAHASSWDNPNRNQIPRTEIERRLLGALGGTKMIWAPGIAGADITDYHIDALARFVGPGQVLIQISSPSDPSDPWSVAAHDTLRILRAAKTASGAALDIKIIDDPIDIREEAEDFVASYINYYVCNGAVIAAQFGDRDADDRAKRQLAALYPGRKIVMLDVDALGRAGGGIHCATQQQPAIQKL